jgi:LysR family transcriptional regulator, glycine cleavage system transcriptional activator
MRPRPNLPSFAALRAFEAVGRLQSFRKASDELCISQSAVSYHIKTLENELGVKVFSRHARGIAFTPEGRNYWDVVCQAFGLVEDGTLALRGSAEPRAVKVSVLPSFATGWLVQRLPRFNAAWPRIRVAIDPRLELADLDRGEADVSIRYGRGDWPEVHSEKLLAERLSPVASPALLRSGPAITQPQDVLNHTLLCVSKPFEWQLWADETGVDLSRARTLQLTEYNIVVQAATDGLGLAMGRQSLISDRLRSASLVQPLDQVVSPASLGYWVCRGRRTPSRETQIFVDWLVDEARLLAILKHCS